MKKIKLGHMGDAHISKKLLKDNLRSLEFIKDEVINDDELDALIVPGDVWDGEIPVKTSSPFYPAVQIFNDIAKIKPILMIYGNHEDNGSLNVFSEINKNIYVCTKELELVYLYEKKFYSIDSLKLNKHPVPNNIFFCLTYPRANKWIPNKKIHDGEVKNELMDKEIKKEFLKQEKYLKELGINDPIKIIVAHGSLEGYLQQNDTSFEDYSFSVDTFNSIKPDYVALGHIHKFQTLMDGKACYPSSICPINFGEKDEKYLCKIQIADKKFKFEKIKIPTRGFIVKTFVWDKEKDDRKFIKEINDFYKDAREKTNENLFEISIIAPSKILTKFDFSTTEDIKVIKTLIFENPKEIKFIPNESLHDLFKRWHELKNKTNIPEEILKKHKLLLDEITEEEGI